VSERDDYADNDLPPTPPLDDRPPLSFAVAMLAVSIIAGLLFFAKRVLERAF
jgi:hypothetical protein